MAPIKSQLQLNDQMTAVLKKMNTSLLTCIDSFESMQRTSSNAVDVDAINEARSTLIGVNQQLENMGDNQEDFNRSLSAGAGAADNLANKLMKAAAAYVSISSVKNLIQDSLEAADVQIQAQVQLKTVMANTGSLDYYDDVLDKAKEIQSKGIYGDEAMIAGAGELATYFSDGEALLSMMDTLSNYAMGMSGGGEVDPKAMVDYATGIGKIMTGSYDAMTKKGFEFTDAQKAIIEGTATQAQIAGVLGDEYLNASQEMQAAAVINQIISESWDGLYENMSNTPQGAIIQLKNAFGDLMEQIGVSLYPVVMQFIDVIRNNMPAIETAVSGFASLLGTILGILTSVAGAALEFATVIQENWAWIEPIILGIVAALVAYEIASKAVAAAIAIHELVEGTRAAAAAMATGATLAETAAQYGLNAALLACPLTWIILLIVAVIVAIIAFIKHVGGLTNAWNICKAALLVAWNALRVAWAAVVVGITWGINKVMDFVDLLKLCWQRAGTAIANFIGDMKASVLMILQNMVNGAIDIINGFIDALNLIPGVNIDTIAHVTFGTEAQLANEAEKQARAADLAQYEADIEAGKAAREANLQAAKDDLASAVNDLSDSAAEVSRLYNASTSVGDDSAPTLEDFVSSAGAFESEGMAQDVSDIAKNTGTSAAATKDTKEDLSYLRDIAEQEAVNRFTTAEVHIDMTGMTNRIDSNMDLDGVLNTLTEGFAEALEVAAEGVHV